MFGQQGIGCESDKLKLQDWCDDSLEETHFLYILKVVWVRCFRAKNFVQDSFIRLKKSTFDKYDVS